MLGIFFFFGKCFGFTVDAGFLNLNFFWGVSTSCSGGISGSTSGATGGCDGCGSSVCSVVDLSFLLVDVLSFSDMVGLLPGLYSCPMMDVKNFFLLTWNKSEISVCRTLNFVQIHFCS